MIPVFLQRLNFPKKLGFFERCFGDALKKKGICEVMTGSGLVWKLDLRNPTHRWIVYGLYDPPFLSWARRFLPSDGIVVDSGANIGQTVMYLGQYVREGKLLAFEPGSHQGDWLETCVAKNCQKFPGVKILRTALGARSEYLFLEDTWKSEKFHGGSSQISYEKGEPVKVTRLDEALKALDIGHVDLWKLDVEGHEIQALEGAGEFLKAGHIRALYVELYRQEGPDYFEHGKKIRQYLARQGYRCHIFRGMQGLVEEKSVTYSVNGLFLKT